MLLSCSLDAAQKHKGAWLRTASAVGPQLSALAPFMWLEFESEFAFGRRPLLLVDGEVVIPFIGIKRDGPYRVLLLPCELSTKHAAENLLVRYKSVLAKNSIDLVPARKHHTIWVADPGKLEFRSNQRYHHSRTDEAFTFNTFFGHKAYWNGETALYPYWADYWKAKGDPKPPIESCAETQYLASCWGSNHMGVQVVDGHNVVAQAVFEVGKATGSGLLLYEISRKRNTSPRYKNYGLGNAVLYEALLYVGRVGEGCGEIDMGIAIPYKTEQWTPVDGRNQAFTTLHVSPVLGVNSERYDR